MIKCYKNEANLKSTAYNQTGQNIFEQLSAYNSMSSHLRRILLAKSVVDSRNKSYVHKRKNTCRPADCRSELPKLGVTSELIDKLAHDSLHHPPGILRMSFDGKYGHQRKEQKRYVNCYEDYDIKRSGPGIQNPFSYEESDPTASRSRPRSRTHKSAVFPTNGRSEKHRDSSGGYGRKTESTSTRFGLKTQNHFLKDRYEETSSPGESYSDFATPEMDRLSPLTNSSESSEDRESVERHDKCITTSDSERRQDENAKYAEFIYEITREVMQNSLYTDEELEEVFQRHVNKNKGTLNMNKMLYEIYQLKMSLNMSDNSDDDELEDLIHTQQLLNVSRIRPPTPPKVLDENKIRERLLSYQTLDDVKRRSSVSGGKTVVLIDANPELLVTERDILTSLVEADVDINRAEKICKSIFQKGREMGTEVQQANTYKDVPSKENSTRSNFTQVSKEENDFVTNDRVSPQYENVAPEINGKLT